MVRTLDLRSTGHGFESVIYPDPQGGYNPQFSCDTPNHLKFKGGYQGQRRQSWGGPGGPPPPDIFLRGVKGEGKARGGEREGK